MAEMYYDFDGQTYKVGEPHHDLGSFTCTEVLPGNVRKYSGLSGDYPKLPTYCGNGSSAYMIDTGELYMFSKDSESWERQ